VRELDRNSIIVTMTQAESPYNPFFRVEGNVVKGTPEMLEKGTFGQVEKKHLEVTTTNTTGDEETLTIKTIVTKRAHYTHPEDGEPRTPEILREGAAIAKALMQQEIGILEYLKKRNNTYTPKILTKRAGEFDMSYIEGTDGCNLALEGNADTAMAVFETWITTVNEIYKDGVVNLDTPPRNFIVKTSAEGYPQASTLIDFGYGFLVEDQKIAIPKELVSSSWILPPEVAKSGNTGETISINAESAAVFALGYSLNDLLGGYPYLATDNTTGLEYLKFKKAWFVEDQRDDKKHSEPRVYLKEDHPLLTLLEHMLDEDPSNRPTLEEVAVKISKIITKDHTGPCISEETLKTRRDLARDAQHKRKIVIPEEDVDKVIGDLKALHSDT
jgi:serine/threonine protein kinase